MSDVPPRPMAASPPKWKPLPALDRRVAGVLVEKAKTTPDIYPMSINAIVAGCNQKSNRHPLLQVEADDVEEALDRLRQHGAAAVIQGGGRVAKYRHYLYEWLGVDKVEMAVMTELLLRGAQTEGELRGRAARMEPIADVAALRPVLNSLKAKGLIVSLTGEGRGHVLTHNLYEPREMEKLKTQFADGNYVPSGDGDEVESRPAARPAPAASAAAPRMASSMPVVSGNAPSASAADLNALRAEIAQLRSDLGDISNGLRNCQDELQQLKTQLGA